MESTSKRFAHAGLIVAVSLALGFPALYYGLPWGHDAFSHLSRYRCFWQQFWAADLYPRWLMGMNFNQGSPMMFVYPPLSYFITAILHPLYGLYHGASKEAVELGVSFWLALACSGLAMYHWLRQLVRPWAALAGAVAYMLVPYHVTIDLYNRAALAETWAFVWMPLALYSVVRLVRPGDPVLPSRARQQAVRATYCGAGTAPSRSRLGNGSVGIGLAVNFALLMLTHSLTAVLFSWVPVAYAVAVAPRNGRRAALGKAMASLALGGGLAAIYILPAAAHMAHISMERQIELAPEHSYTRHFIFPERIRFAPRDGEANFMLKLSLMTVWAVAVAVACLVVGWKSPSPVRRRECLFWILAAGISFGMMLPFSRPIWQVLPVLRSVQFPWRFNSVISVAAAALIALAADSLRRPIPRWKATAAICTLVGILSWYYPLARIERYSHRWVSATTGLENMEEPWMFQVWAATTVLYPVEGQSTVQPKPGIVGPLFGSTGKHDFITRASAQVLHWAPRDIRFAVNPGKAGRWMDIAQLYYPGWIAEAPGVGGLPLEASKPEGLMRIWVPRGAAEVRLFFPWGLDERLGLLLSLLSAASLAAIQLRRMRVRKREQGAAVLPAETASMRPVLP